MYHVSFGDEFVHNPDSISNVETPDFSYPPSQPQTSSFDQFHCFGCGDPLEESVRCQRCTCKWCRYGLRKGFCLFYASRDGNSSIDVPNLNSFNDPPNVFTHPPQPQYDSYSCELCGNDTHYGYDCPPCYNSNYSGFDQPMQYIIDHQEDLNQQRMNDVDDRWNKMIELGNKIIQILGEMILQRKQVANLSNYTPEPSRHFNFIYDDDDDYEESTIPLNEIDSQIPPSIAIAPVLLTMEPEDSRIMGDEDLNTIHEKESDEVIKSSVEHFVPIPSETEDTSGSDSECDFLACDDFSPINVSKGKSMTFSNPFFDSNDDVTSSYDESLSDVDVPEDNVLENIENKDSYDETDLLVTPLSDANEDECFDPRGDIDKIDAFDIPLDFEDGYYDSEGDVLYIESLLSDDTTPYLPPKEFLDRDPRSLSDTNDLKIMVKVFDPGTPKKTFSPTYMRLPFKDRHYIFFTYVIRIFLPYFTYPVDSLFLLSYGSENTIFDPGILAFHFLAPVASHRSGISFASMFIQRS
uniref:Pre-mRNA splicing Prp18-interacting factor n=1 Tax=Tanacetum cinerariifolium TaxID=118510 RepID=A0A6L2J680_TANCI|nr:hypothetical protein [Tanacetum cinerariifolium]